MILRLIESSFGQPGHLIDRVCSFKRPCAGASPQVGPSSDLRSFPDTLIQIVRADFHQDSRHITEPLAPMKLSTIVFGALLAVASAEAAPEPNNDRCQRPGQPCSRSAAPEPGWNSRCQRPGQPCSRSAAPEPGWNSRCQRPGQPCSKLKRAAEIADEAAHTSVDDVALNPRCYMAGQACALARREALAIAEAVLDAADKAGVAVAAQEGAIAKREALDLHEAAAHASAGTFPDFELGRLSLSSSSSPFPSLLPRWRLRSKANVRPSDTSSLDAKYAAAPVDKDYTHATKREALAEAEAAAAALAEAYAAADPNNSRCRRPGQPCSRAAAPEPGWNSRCQRPGQPCSRDAAPEAMPEAEANNNRCQRPGQACSKVRRAVAAIADLSADSEAAEGDDEEMAKARQQLGELHKVVAAKL